MLFGLFGKKQDRCLGIDFGASGVKIAELGRAEKNRLVLQNYVIGQTKIDSKFSISKLDEAATAKIIKNLLAKAGISTRRAVISLPLGETFSAIIELPAMPEADLIRAIPYEAQKYVPISFDEVVLDWIIVDRSAAEIVLPSGKRSQRDLPSTSGNVGSGKLQVFIVAVPKELIKKIAKIAKAAELTVLAIEQEAFSIVRSLVGRDETAFLIVDLGREDADFIFVDKNFIRLTFSFDLEKKPDLFLEAANAVGVYYARYNKKIAKIILTGGRAQAQGQPDWAAAFSERLKIPAGIGDPFARLTFDPKLMMALKGLAPFMAAAVGAAMREL